MLRRLTLRHIIIESIENDDTFVVTGLGSRQWPQSWHYDNSRFSVANTRVRGLPHKPGHLNHMMTSSNGNIFPRYWPFVRGIQRAPVNSPHKGQWRGALMFSLICTWINGWINNREAGDLRRHRAHYDVTVMSWRDIAAWTPPSFAQVLLKYYDLCHLSVPCYMSSCLYHHYSCSVPVCFTLFAPEWHIS